MLTVGSYYIYCAWYQALPFFRATVYGRISVLRFFIAFAALGWTRALLVVASAVDFAGSAGTALAVRRDATRAAASAGA